MAGTGWTKWCCIGSKTCHLQFHIRFFAINAAVPGLPRKCPANGLSIRREKGALDLIDGSTGFDIRESRIGTATITRFDTEVALYSLVLLVDLKSDKPEDLYGQDAWNDMCEEMHVNSCGKFKGIVMFQVEMYEVLREWGRRWTNALHHIELVAPLKVWSIIPSSGS
jgi:hypothetical protein